MESLHNHTTFSDGRNLPAELIEKSIKAGLKVVAITDHYEYFRGFLDKWSDLGLYFATISHLKKKYADKIKILSGLEIDFQICEDADLPLEFVECLDLVLFERIGSYEDLKKLARFRRLFGPVKVGLAHPELKDVFDFWKLVDFLEKNNLFVELNTSCYYSLGKKPVLVFETQEEFFKLLKGRKVKVSIGTDSHYKHDLVENLDRAYAFIDKLGLRKNLIKWKKN